MATVYLAEDLKHKRLVAVKVLRPELAVALGPDRFLREIETTANLRHPHILPLYDSGEADGFLFYIMPLVEGETLRDRLDRERRVSVEDADRLRRADPEQMRRDSWVPAYEDLTVEFHAFERDYMVALLQIQLGRTAEARQLIDSLEAYESFTALGNS